MFIKKLDYKVFTINFRDFDWVVKSPYKFTLDTSIDLKTIIFSKYQKFFNIFSYQKSD